MATAVKPHIPIDRTMILLAFAFAAAWSVTGAMAAHLPRILEAAGATTLQAVAAGALIMSEAKGCLCTLDHDDFWAAPLWRRSVIAALDPALFESWKAWLRLHAGDPG